MVEFAANNHVNLSSRISPFFADNGFYSRVGIEPLGALEVSQRAKLLKVNQIVANQEQMMTFLQDQLTWAQQEQAYWAN